MEERDVTEQLSFNYCIVAQSVGDKKKLKKKKGIVCSGNGFYTKSSLQLRIYFCFSLRAFTNSWVRYKPGGDNPVCLSVQSDGQQVPFQIQQKWPHPGDCTMNHGSSPTRSSSYVISADENICQLAIRSCRARHSILIYIQNGSVVEMNFIEKSVEIIIISIACSSSGICVTFCATLFFWYLNQEFSSVLKIIIFLFQLHNLGID